MEEVVGGQRFRERACIVTGAAQGLGRVLVHRLLSEGANVIAADLQGDRVRRVAAELGAETGNRVLPYVGDLSEPAVADEMARLCIAEFGRIDALINNAAVIIRLPFLEFTDDLMQKALAGNWWQMVRCCRAVLPQMLDQGFGRIIGIGGSMPAPYHTFLQGCKGAMLGLTRSLALEVAAHGITVNVVSPAGIDADRDGDPKAEPRYQDSSWTPEHVVQDLQQLGAASIGRGIGRVADPREVAAAVAFLASTEASYITGQELRVTGSP